MWLEKLGKFNTCRVDRQVGGSGKSCSSNPEAIYWQNSFLLRGSQTFTLFRPETQNEGQQHGTQSDPEKIRSLGLRHCGFPP